MLGKVIVTLVTVGLVSWGAYGLYQFALGGHGMSAQEMLQKLLDETVVKVANAKTKVSKFGDMVQELHRAAARSQFHAQALLEKEAKARHVVETVESELKFMKSALESNEPIRYADGKILAPDEVELRVLARGEELAAVRECYSIIRNEREHFERLHAEQMKNLRLAPSHIQVLQVRLNTLEMKAKLFAEQKSRLDQTPMSGEDLYTSLYNEAKQAIGEAELSVTPAMTTVDGSLTGFKPLLREGSEEKVTSSGASTDSALARINALLAAGK